MAIVFPRGGARNIPVFSGFLVRGSPPCSMRNFSSFSRSSYNRHSSFLRCAQSSAESNRRSVQFLCFREINNVRSEHTGHSPYQVISSELPSSAELCVTYWPTLLVARMRVVPVCLLAMGHCDVGDDCAARVPDCANDGRILAAAGRERAANNSRRKAVLRS
jgi:hypothetical protein